jgi:hypothetical protein
MRHQLRKHCLLRDRREVVAELHRELVHVIAREREHAHVDREAVVGDPG